MGGPLAAGGPAAAVMSSRAIASDWKISNISSFNQLQCNLKLIIKLKLQFQINCNRLWISMTPAIAILHLVRTNTRGNHIPMRMRKQSINLHHVDACMGILFAVISYLS